MVFSLGNISRCLFVVFIRKKYSFLGIIILFYLAYMTLRKFFVFTTLNSLLEVHKCPACYGVSLCDEFYSEKFQLRPWHFTKFLNRKNVFLANSRVAEVIFKKLGHDAELNKFDRYLCKLAYASEECNVSKAMTTVNSQVEFTELMTLGASKTDFMQCPTMRLFHTLKKSFRENTPNKRDSYGYMLTLVSINPEPLILQIFRNEDGWPFPRYLGSCGRIVVEEFIGDSLAAYNDAPWQKRLALALQVVQIALALTNTTTGFHLYMTDVTADNFAVNSNGRVFVVDTEGIIVVDYQSIDNDNWYQSVSYEEGANRLSFSYLDLCGNKITDHNYYVICQGLLAFDAWSSDVMPGGLLHDVPLKVTSRWKLRELIAECSKPKKKLGRFAAIRLLEDALQNAVLDTLRE